MAWKRVGLGGQIYSQLLLLSSSVRVCRFTRELGDRQFPLFPSALALPWIHLLGQFWTCNKIWYPPYVECGCKNVGGILMKANFNLVLGIWGFCLFGVFFGVIFFCSGLLFFFLISLVVEEGDYSSSDVSVHVQFKIKSFLLTSLNVFTGKL